MVSDVQKAALSPETVLAQMKKNGVTHVVRLPDSETNWLFLLMQADPSLTLVGVNRDGHLIHVGRVGTGFGGDKVGKLWPKLKKLETDENPFGGKTAPRKKPEIHWVKPQLVAEIRAFIASQRR